jgi:hypothetical protein
MQLLFCLKNKKVAGVPPGQGISLFNDIPYQSKADNTQFAFRSDHTNPVTPRYFLKNQITISCHVLIHENEIFKPFLF